MGFMPFLFPLLVVLLLLWMIGTYLNEPTEQDVPPSAPYADSDHNSLIQQKGTTLNKDSPYSSLRRQTKIKDQKSFVLATDKPQNEPVQDHYPQMPEALRPRRPAIIRPEEDTDNEEESTLQKPSVFKNSLTQTEEDESDPPPLSLKCPVATQTDQETEDAEVQTNPFPVRISRGIQTDHEHEETGIQTEAPVVRIPFSSEEDSDSLESYPLKPRYLSSPSQSEEEPESSESSGTLKQRYSIIQPFMPDKKELEEE